MKMYFLVFVQNRDEILIFFFEWLPLESARNTYTERRMLCRRLFFALPTKIMPDDI